MAPFKVGDVVCHKAAFLRSVGWFTEVPINGRVNRLRQFGANTWPVVEWADGNAGMVNPANIILYSERHKELA
jgi:hypothetical protein